MYWPTSVDPDPLPSLPGAPGGPGGPGKPGLNEPPGTTTQILSCACRNNTQIAISNKQKTR